MIDTQLTGFLAIAILALGGLLVITCAQLRSLRRAYIDQALEAAKLVATLTTLRRTCEIKDATIVIHQLEKELRNPAKAIVVREDRTPDLVGSMARLTGDHGFRGYFGKIVQHNEKTGRYRIAGTTGHGSIWQGWYTEDEFTLCEGGKVWNG